MSNLFLSRDCVSCRNMPLEHPPTLLKSQSLTGSKTFWRRILNISGRHDLDTGSVPCHRRIQICRNTAERWHSTTDFSQWSAGNGWARSIRASSAGPDREEAHMSTVKMSAAADEAGFTASSPAESAASAEISSAEEKRGSRDNNLIERLKACGIAGVISYGILNTLYYLTAFLVVFLKVSPLERGAGFAAAAKHCIMLLAVVWAGSQVTKLPRVLGALMLTPWVDRVLHWLTSTNRARSKTSVLAVTAAVCFGAAGLIFLCLVALWA